MSKTLTVQATVPEKKDAQGVVTQVQVGPFSINIEAAGSAQEAIEMYGDASVLSNALANWTVTLQSNMRSQMKKGATVEAIQTALATAKMGVAASGVKVDPVQAYLAMFQSATPEKQKEMLAELRNKAAK
jgi:hypothetical protein